MTDPEATAPALPPRVVVGGYSIDPTGDAPEAGTGLRVLDRVLGSDGAPAYATVGHAPLTSPTWVARHPHQPWLLSISETDPSAVVCTRVLPDGSLAVLGRRQTGGSGGCHLALSPDGRWVVVAHYGSGSVETFALDDEGHLTGPVGRFVSAAPLGPDPDRQDGPHAHQVVADPGRLPELLVCDLGTDRVHRLHLGTDGRLVQAADALVLPPGSGPRHLVVAGDTLLVGCELSVELWVARRTGDGWRHTSTVPTTSLPVAEREPGEAPVLVSEVQVVAEHVVVATRGVDTLATFRLDATTSTLDRVAEVSCAGHHPRDLVVADGLAWVANQWSDEVVALDLAAVTAGLETEPVCRVGTPRPSRVLLPDQRSARPSGAEQGR